MPRKSRALLAYVAESQHPLRRTDLAQIFCRSTVDPRRTLRTLLSHINKAGEGLLSVAGEFVAVGKSISVDTRQFEKSVRQGRFDSQVIALYRDEFMAGEELPDSPQFEMWLLGRRTYYRSLLEKCLQAAIEVKFSSQQYDQALKYAQRLVQENPYLELGREYVIRAHQAMDHYQAAAEYYQEFQTFLEKEIGIPPTHRLMELANQPSSEAKLGVGHSQFRPDLRYLLFNPEQLQAWIGPVLPPERLQRIQDWAKDTVELSMALYAYHSADAALETQIAFAAQDGAVDSESVYPILQRILIAETVNWPLSAQRKALERVELWLRDKPAEPAQGLFLLARSAVHYREGRYRRAIHAADQAQAWFQQQQSSRLAGRAATLKGQSQLRVGENRQAMITLKTAQQRLANVGDLEGQSIALAERAWAAINLGQIDRAFNIIQNGMTQFGPVDSAPLMSRLAYTLAACWNYYYDHAQMERWANQAIALFEQIGNQTMANRCQIYLVQADRYRMRNDAAADRLSRLFQHCQAHHDTWSLAWTMALMALSHLKKGHLDQAERWYSQAYGLRRQTGERQNQVYDLVYMGRLRAAQGQLSRALHYSTAAVQQMIAGRHSFFPWEAWDMYLAHAEVLRQSGNVQAARSAVDAGYQALQHFLQGVRKPAHRRQIRQSENAVHLLQARQTGQIIPFHQREHRWL